jgi:sugar fermentation stimulation protein A
MHYPVPLQPGVLIQRYKRFFADVALDDGTTVTAHCPNPGAMLGTKTPGSRVWLSRSADPRRKLPLTLELIQAGGTLVGVNTLLPNRIVAEALAVGAIPEISSYDRLRPEVRYDEACRIDFLLESEDRPPCWLEVKSVTLSRTPGLAEFPDCRTSRGGKHLAALARRVAAGERAVMLFLIQRSDCDRFDVARDLDPPFAAALADAAAAGVEVLCYASHLTPEQNTLSRRVPWTPQDTA